MAKRGKRTDQAARERDAADREHGQGRALGENVERSGGGSAHEERPDTEAGAPPVQQQERDSLDNPSQSGRPRDEGDDRIERTGAQKAPRRDSEAVRPPGSPGPDDNTL